MIGRQENWKEEKLEGTSRWDGVQCLLRMWLITTSQYVNINFHVLMSYILLCVTYRPSNLAPSDFNVKYTVLSLTPTIRLFKCSSLTFNAPSNALAHFIHSQKGNYSGTQQKIFYFFQYVFNKTPSERGRYAPTCVLCNTWC